MRAAGLIAACIAAYPATADQGELQLGAAVALEASTIRHPLSGLSLGIAAPFSLVPHVALETDYGITNELHLRVGLDGGGAPNIPTDGVVIGGRATRLVTGTYVELAAPVGIGWRMDSGLDASGAILVELAPMATVWSATAATDPASRTHDGLARRLPVEVADSANLGIQARLQVVFDARLLGSLGLHAGAYVGAAWAGTPSLRAGLVIAPSWMCAPGAP